jgi:hypothetical protein
MIDSERAKVIGTGRITGSIQAIYASTEITITDCTTGKFVGVTDSGSNAIDINHVNSGNRVDQTTTDNIVAPAGTYLPGPFIAVNVSAGTGVLYYNGDLAVTGS